MKRYISIPRNSSGRRNNVRNKVYERSFRARINSRRLGGIDWTLARRSRLTGKKKELFDYTKSALTSALVVPNAPSPFISWADKIVTRVKFRGEEVSEAEQRTVRSPERPFEEICT